VDRKAAQQWLADGRLVRCVVDAILRRCARRRLVELDCQAAARCQARVLRGLVHQARNTRFGRDHDFTRIRTPADFRRLVPLRTAARFWRDYGQPYFPQLEGVAWPEPASYLVPADEPPSPALPFVPLSASLLRSHRLAALTALAMVLGGRPRARLFSGRILFVGGTPAPAASQVVAWSPDHATTRCGHDPVGSVAEAVLAELPALLRPYFAWTTVPDGGADFADERCRFRVEECIRLPVTGLVGPAGRLRRFLEGIRQRTECDRITDIWPGLTAVLYGHAPASEDRARLMDLIGSASVVCLGMWFRPEGMLAVEDPRYGLLRLLVDHGLYYEFVLADTLDAAKPTRVGVGEVETGVPYAVALSSPAGLWACLLGSMVRFERRQPPLFCLEEVPAPREEPAPEETQARTDAPAVSLSAPHPRSGDIPAGPPGTPFHTPWSARADRG
jgi:hypothetical protein